MTIKIMDFGTELEAFRKAHKPSDFAITHPEWKRVTENFAKRLGIKAPELIRVPTPFINACATGEGKMYISDGLMKLLECDHQGAPSRPMQSVIAHEMGHFKYDMKNIRKFVAVQTSWVTLPLASVLGLALYEYAVNSIPTSPAKLYDKKKIMAHIDGAIDKTLEEETKKVEQEQGNQDYISWLKHNLYSSRYVVAAVLGMTGGLMLSRHVGNVAEFRADRVAVELMGETESFAALEKLGGAAKKVWKEHNPEPTEFGEKMEYWLAVKWRNFKNSIFHAHPESAERVSHVEEHLARVKQADQPLHVPDFTPFPAR